MTHTLQARHSQKVEKHHYALSVNMITETINWTLHAFHQICELWHKLLFFRDSETIVQQSQVSLSAVTSHSSFTNSHTPLRSVTTSLNFGRSTKSLRWPATVINDVSQDDCHASLSLNKRRRTTSPERLQAQRVEEFDSVLKCLHLLHEPSASFKSERQQEAVWAILHSCYQDVLVILLISSEKTLIMLILTFLCHNHVTIIMIPFVALHQKLAICFQNAGI